MTKAQVLVIDDSAAAMDVVVQTLYGFGVLHAICANSGKDAQSKCASTAFDLILCDSDMRGMNGYEFMSWLRRSHDNLNSRTACIILSGHASETNIKRARDSGANFTIAKPISPRVLLEKIRWVTKDVRPFIDAKSYCGPDRRNRAVYPNPSRRADDNDIISPEVAGVELSQSSIDDLFN